MFETREACFGNHEADVGLPALKKRVERWHERAWRSTRFIGRKWTITGPTFGHVNGGHDLPPVSTLW